MNSVLFAHETMFCMEFAWPWQASFYDRFTPEIEPPDTLFNSVLISPCSLAPCGDNRIRFIALSVGKDD